MSALRQGGGDGLIVAVVGALDPEEARELARLRHSGITGVAVLLDVDTWDGDAPGSAENLQAVADRAGRLWAGAIVRLPAGVSIASVWPDAASRGRYSPHAEVRHEALDSGRGGDVHLGHPALPALRGRPLVLELDSAWCWRCWPPAC